MRTSRIRVLVATLACVLVTGAPAARTPPEDGEFDFVPLRVRDLTLPAAILLGFEPSAAIGLGRGNWAFELNLSLANNFQVSRNVERYLRERGGPRAPLSEEDVRAILELPGDAFYLDGEFVSTRLSAHYGLTDRTHVAVSAPYFHFTGGSLLDDLVYDFHDAFGFGQAGRQYVADDRWQAIFDLDDDPENGLVLLDAPTPHGWGDPTFLIHHAFPEGAGGWRFAVEAAYKPALADEDRFLSTGNDDFGVQIVADRTWDRWGFVANASWVRAGNFATLPQFEVADPIGLNVTWVRRTRGGAQFLIQALTGDSVFREATDSALSELQIQASIGMRWRIADRTFGFAITENVANFDNTPDIAVHLFVGVLRR